MSASNKVGELFKTAGQAFDLLGELTIQLHPSSEQSITSGKWTDAEIEMLMGAVQRFSEDLNKVSETIKARTIAQIRSQMKRKAFEEAGLAAPTAAKVPAMASSKQMVSPPAGVDTKHVKTDKSADVTLSALNATESDVDIESLTEHHLNAKHLSSGGIM